MSPVLREFLETADQMVETVVEEESLRLKNGLAPGERRETVNNVFDLQQARALLHKVIFS